VPNFKTYEEAEKHVQEQWRIFAEKYKKWWNSLPPEEQMTRRRNEILWDKELTPYGKQKFLRELEEHWRSKGIIL